MVCLWVGLNEMFIILLVTQAPPDQVLLDLLIVPVLQSNVDTPLSGCSSLHSSTPACNVVRMLYPVLFNWWYLVDCLNETGDGKKVYVYLFGETGVCLFEFNAKVPMAIRNTSVEVVNRSDMTLIQYLMLSSPPQSLLFRSYYCMFQWQLQMGGKLREYLIIYEP